VACQEPGLVIHSLAHDGSAGIRLGVCASAVYSMLFALRWVFAFTLSLQLVLGVRSRGSRWSGRLDHHGGAVWLDPVDVNY